MPLPITYAAVANQVNAWCNNNCINVGTRWDTACPAWCKSGWVSADILFAGNDVAFGGSKYRFNLINGITQVDALNTNNTQTNNGGFGAFLAKRGATLTNTIPKSEWLDVVKGIAEWCAISISFMGNFRTERGTTDPTVYLVWKSTTGPSIDYSSLADYKYVIAEEINTMITDIINKLNSTSRCISAQYTISLFSS